MDEWFYGFFFYPTHTPLSAPISTVPCIGISGEMSLRHADCSPRDGPLGFLWGNLLLFNPVTQGLHKRISCCPLQSVEETLLLVSTISSTLLMLYDLCPRRTIGPFAFQCSYLFDLCRGDGCHWSGKSFIRTLCLTFGFWEVYCSCFKSFTFCFNMTLLCF